MLFSFRPPNADYLGFPATVEGIVSTSQRAETLGYDAVFVNDHIIVKGPDELVASWGNTFDPLATLAYLAAVTDKVKLGTSVLIVPYRNPIATAKMLATIDQFCSGRLIVGVGAGWQAPEFEALGLPHERRGAMTDEFLDVYRACWAPDPVSFKGEFHEFEGMHCSPKPVQSGGPPLWVGGFTKPALRRAARVAEVWQPVPMALDAFRDAKAYLQQACKAIGREEMPRSRMSFRVNFTHITGKSARGSDGERLRGHGKPEEIAADLRVFVEQAGLEEFQINFNGCGALSELDRSMGVFMDEVRPLVEA